MTKTGQSRKGSLLEAVINTAIGLLVTFLVLPIVNWACNVEMNTAQMSLHVVLMTAVSILRNYVIRRFFNKVKL